MRDSKQHYGPDLIQPGDDQYVNFGVALQQHRRDRLNWWLDTWYVDIYEVVGKLAFGDGPLTAADGIGDFLGSRLRATYEALSPLLRLRPPVRIAFKRIPRSLDTFIVELLEEDMDSLLTAVSQRLAVPTDTFVYISSNFDVLAWVSDPTGSPQERWLPDSAGLLSLAHASQSVLQESESGVMVPWRALLDIDVVSLFRRNNDEHLNAAREAWRQLRQRQPSETVFTEEMNRSPIMTLANPPRGTPSGNHVLHDLNAPRLRNAISRWEQAMGHAFEWEAGLD